MPLHLWTNLWTNIQLSALFLHWIYLVMIHFFHFLKIASLYWDGGVNMSSKIVNSLSLNGRTCQGWWSIVVNSKVFSLTHFSCISETVHEPCHIRTQIMLQMFGRDFFSQVTNRFSSRSLSGMMMIRKCVTPGALNRFIFFFLFSKYPSAPRRRVFSDLRV